MIENEFQSKYKNTIFFKILLELELQPFSKNEGLYFNEYGLLRFQILRLFPKFPFRKVYN